MAYPDIATKGDLANELKDHATSAGAHEILIDDVAAVLTAILDGGLLDAVPANDTDRGRHNAAVHLLCDLSDKMRVFEDRPGTNLSISIGVLARDVAEGRFSHRRVLEDIRDMPHLMGAR